MRNFNKKLFPFTQYADMHRRNIFFALFVTVFLLLFRPFGLNVYSYERGYIIIGYGLIIWLTLLFNDFLAYRFLPGVFSEKKWTVKAQIWWAFIQLFITGITCFLYAVAINAFPQNLLSFIKIELYVLLSSIIPIVMFILIKQNYLLRQNTRQAEVLNNELHGLQKTDFVQPNANNIQFVGDNQNDRLEITPQQIHYITSQDNYFEVVWQAEQKINKKLLRGTLAKAEEAVQSFPSLFRCHRAYIVNLDKVIHVEGNAQGYRLQLQNNPEIIPVSRSRGKQMQQLLQNIR
ncbi:LytTR family transcriptional regulator [Thermoflavifilum aggregans]|uniref:LytTR family transcriptional regulator n=1 Tax=Thermoflavifilum aggregans TaxID=454188 RepID=A0A2M9CX54_9BACT|nr:LytTR family DNA-binding domain-containing protein [Thermoflavifilum aggregans]PJJ76467.1 LytTR family transcriptional regulator [Thermoflavifilum aggregans]